MTKNNENQPKLLTFSCIDPYVSTNIVDSTEKEVRGYDWISWGEKNDYADYLLGLYRNVPTLESIINGCADYVAGDDAIISKEPFNLKINSKGENVYTLIKQIANDWWLYGAFALNIVRNKLGKVAGIYYLNVKNVRSDKKNEHFYYSDDWSKSWGRVKYIEYPKFNTDSIAPNSILYVKNNYNSTYGIPVYQAAVKSAEVMKSIDEYQLNSINNGFMASYIINFNNGQPEKNIQEEIEEELNDKFSGYQNAGRLMVSFNKSKDNAVTLQKLSQDDFGEKFNSLKEWSQQQLFTSFRATPILFGIPSANTGFNDNDVKESFKLFNRTMVLPVQRLICDTFATIFGENVLTIKPFTVDWTDDAEDNNVQ